MGNPISGSAVYFSLLTLDKPLPISKNFNEIFSPSHIKLTYNNRNKDFESVKRPQEVEKFKLDRKIFSSWKKKAGNLWDLNV